MNMDMPFIAPAIARYTKQSLVATCDNIFLSSISRRQSRQTFDFANERNQGDNLVGMTFAVTSEHTRTQS